MVAIAEDTELDLILSQFAPARENLIPILQEIQERQGFLSEEAVMRAADYLDMSENEVFGVATFYAQFRFVPQGKCHVRVCQGTACHVRGSGLIQEAVSRKLGIGPGETSEDGKFSLERVACFGSCALAPLVVVDDQVYGRMTVRKTEKLLEEHA